MSQPAAMPPQAGATSVHVLRWSVCAIAASVTTALLVAVLPALWSMTTVSVGVDALTAGVLLAVASIGILAAARLAVVWALAAVVGAFGARSRPGRLGLRVLAVLSPTLARRFGVGVLTVSATLIGPSPIDASSPSISEPARPGTAPLSTVVDASSVAPRTPVNVSALGSARADLGALEEATSGSTAPAAVRPALSPRAIDASATSRFGPAAPQGEEPPAPRSEESADPDRPPLAWSAEDPSATSTRATPPGSGRTGTDGADGTAEPDEPPADDVETITVRDGDTLWSLTDDLLGPGPDDPAEIARHWPDLHERNRQVIGPDPDHIEPGQQLHVPRTLSPKEQ